MYQKKASETGENALPGTDEAQVADMIAAIKEELGVIDILVNNAGIIKRIPMTEMSVEDFRQVIDIDLNAPFIMAKAV